MDNGNPKKYMKGGFALTSLKKVLQHDRHTSIGFSTFKGGKMKRSVKLPVHGICSMITSDGVGGLIFFVSRVGMHSLYFTVLNNNYVLWDEYKWSLVRRSQRYGDTARIHQVLAGTVYHVHASGDLHETPDFDPIFIPSTISPDTLEEAIDGFETVFLKAAEEMYQLAGKPKITATLSGGTDSTLGVWALQQIGADFKTVTVGRSLDDFDPKWAAIYAKQLGTDHTFIPLPTEIEGIQALLERAIEATEQCEMSNTMMAMCSILVNDFANETGFTHLLHGHYADDIVALSNVSIGAFKKRYDEDDSQAWTSYRAKMYQHIIPNDTQVAKVSRYAPQGSWFSFFYHPLVARYIWSLPIDYVPLAYMKPVYQGVLEKVLPEVAWKTTRKVGYYSGTGIGQIRIDDPVLQDANLRATFQKLKKASIL